MAVVGASEVAAAAADSCKMCPIQSGKLREEASKRLHLQMSGYGMGIPLCRHYSRFFGGDMHFSSIYGYGTDVSIRINRLFSIEEREAADFDSTNDPLSPATSNLYNSRGTQSVFGFELGNSDGASD